MADITKDMKISEILALNELMAPFLMQNGMACVTCAASQAESLEEACEAHGIDVEGLTEISAFLFLFITSIVFRAYN